MKPASVLSAALSLAMLGNALPTAEAPKADSLAIGQGRRYTVVCNSVKVSRNLRTLD